MNKICHLTSVHPPFDTRIFYKECRTLAQAGYDVVLVVPHDRDEVVDGVRIRAVSKPENRRERMTKTVLQVYKTVVAENADIYHFHDPELIPVGIVLKLKGKKVIYDVHEDVPKDILTKDYIPMLLRRPIATGAAIVEHMAAKYLDAIIPATPTISQRFPMGKSVFVQNFPMLNELVTANAMPYSNRSNDIVYVGGIAAIRGIREMVEAIGLLPEALEARLCLAGTFSPAELYNEVCTMPGWKRVKFLGWQTREQVAALLGKARVGLVLLHPTLCYYDALPVKLFEYMSAGIPVVASDFPVWRKIVEETGCGLLVNPLDPIAIADAIQWLLEHPIEAERMGHLGSEAVNSKFNWHFESKKLLSLYSRLLNKQGV